MKKLLLFLLSSVAIAQTQIQGPALIEGREITATSAGTKTLTKSSQTWQIFTGATTHTLVMADATTLPQGRKVVVVNNSSGVVTVEYDDNTTLATVGNGVTKTFYLQSSASSNGTWSIVTSQASGGGGGDVSGPGTSDDGGIVLFDGTSGTSIKQATGSGVAHATNGVFSVGDVDLTSEVTGVLPLANGGTEKNLTASAGAIAYSDANSFEFSAVGSSGQILRSAGTSAPAWSTATYPDTSGNAGRLLVSDGTNWLSSAMDLADADAVGSSILGVANGGSGLSSLGTANQVLGVNNAANASEYKTIAGTASQITVTHGAGSITLSTPQNIATGSSPTFAGLTLSGLSQDGLVTTTSGVLGSTAFSADTFTQYALLAGRGGGQTLTGGTAASNNLVLRSTSNGTKGQVYLDETTAASSSTSGALRVGGGVGVAGALWAAGLLRTETSLVLEDPGAGTNTYTLAAPTLAGNRTITFPAAAPAANQILYSTDTSGTLGWKDEAAAKTWSAEATNYTITATVGSSALTIALKDAAGSDPSVGSPVCFGFRNATASTGTYAQQCATAATSLVISSGSTLGFTSAVASPIYVYAIYSGSAVVLGASRSPQFTDNEVVSSTAEGGAGGADSGTVLYSTAAQTTKAARLIALLGPTAQATAGTWATAPSSIKLLPIPPSGGGAVSSPGPNDLKMGLAFLNCDSSASIVTNPNTMVASIGNVSSGNCSVTLTTGYFSSTPSCFYNRSSPTAGREGHAYTTSATASQVSGASGGTAGDSDGEFMCIGAP